MFFHQELFCRRRFFLFPLCLSHNKKNSVRYRWFYFFSKRFFSVGLYSKTLQASRLHKNRKMEHFTILCLRLLTIFWFWYAGCHSIAVGLVAGFALQCSCTIGVIIALNWQHKTRFIFIFISPIKKRYIEITHRNGSIFDFLWWIGGVVPFFIYLCLNQF